MPQHLRLSAEEQRALGGHGVGAIAENTPAAKAVTKIAQMFKDRRLLFGHMFIDVRDESRWHFLYGDQRDLAGHWTPDGSPQPHVHFINFLWPGRNVRALWEEFGAGKAPGAALHVRFQPRRRPTEDEPSLSDGDR